MSIYCAKLNVNIYIYAENVLEQYVQYIYIYIYIYISICFSSTFSSYI
jgi:hypothetical protein